MTLRGLVHGPVTTREEWDGRLAQLSTATPFQRAGWIEAWAAAVDGVPVFVSEPSSSGFLAAGVWTRTGSGEDLYVPRGPAGADTDAIARAIDALRGAHPGATIRVGPYVARDQAGWHLAQRMAALGFRDTGARWHRATVRVRLDDEGVMWRRLSENARRNIARARRLGVRVEEDASMTAMNRLYALYAAFMRSRGQDLDPQLLFVHLVEPFVREDLGALFFTYQGERLCSAALVLRVGALLWLSRAPSALDGGEPFGTFLQWEIMRWARGRGCTVFDLGGAETRDDGESLQTGLTRFKLSLGGALVPTIPELACAPVAGRPHAAPSLQSHGEGRRDGPPAGSDPQAGAHRPHASTKGRDG